MRIMQSAYSNFSKNAKGRKSSISFARKAVLALLLSAALCVGVIPAHADTDTAAPVLTHTLSSEGWTNTSVTVNLSVTDNGGSGVSQVAYKRATDDVYTVLWSGSQDAVETSFSTTANGAYKVRLVDVAGNDDVRDVIISTIDRTAPTFSSVKTPGGWTAEDVTVTISATDAGGSGVNKIWYKVPGATDFTLLWSNDDPANNHPTSQAASFIAEERGRYRVKIADVAGNEYTGSVQISNIDRTVPDTPDVYVTNTSGDDLVEINGRKWSNEDVMVHIREAEQIATSFLTFSSPNAFTLSSAAGEKTWDGILEYSTNLTSWTTWDGTTSIDSSSDATHVLYVRGTGNTIITGAGETVNWVLDGSNIECSGNIEYLLDYNTAATGEHPTMGDKAFRALFKGCSALTSAPELPAEGMTESCYAVLFYDCVNLEEAPELPATTLAPYCYNSMFRGCTGLTMAPELNAATMADYCYQEMFYQCTGLIAPPALPATTLAAGCYRSMFYGCSNMVDATELPATALASYCYYSMFHKCSSLVEAPELPATTLVPYCYHDMFSNCTSLTTAPELPATTLADWCYASMFYGCTSLTAAPELPATTLTNGCYSYMFRGCTSLTTAPELPVTTLAQNCYAGMFYGCTSLTAAPELPATRLVYGCYTGMFSGCTSLATAPGLPATTLAERCYNEMFSGCTSLTTAPELPVTMLAKYCYAYMFSGCTSIKLSATKTNEYGIPYRVPISGNGVTASNALSYMFAGTGGTFTGTPEINRIYYLWGRDPADTAIKFSSDNTFTLATANGAKNWDGTLEYSTDLKNWTTWDGTTTLNSSDGAEHVLYVRGTGNTVISGGSGKGWTLTGSNISCSGNIENLLNHETVTAGEHPSMGKSCYSYMFRDCTSLTTAPELPATTLAGGCYERMFSGCTSLATAPELPATTLAGGCYYYMFSGCTSLTTAPELPATTLASSCYGYMFQQCTDLITPPALPATTLAVSCYTSMFNGCTSLATAPELPATTLADQCYRSMFQDCTSLTAAPELPATTLANSCYANMFYGCTSLTTAPELPATTLANYCYQYMFYNCTSLTTAPELPATTLRNYCYSYMFFGCTGIKLSATKTNEYGIPYRVPISGNGVTASSALSSMFSSTGGTFRGTPVINRTYYLWGRDPADTAIKFSSDNAFTLATANGAQNWDGTLEYSTDLKNWTTWDGTTTLNSSDGTKHVLYVRGTDNSYITGGYGKGWTLTGSKISCSGNIENLLNHETVTAGGHPSMGVSCYEYMFSNCTNLTAAPKLPATTLARRCYFDMFNGCTSLTTAPELPATTLAEECYSHMFEGCTSLTAAPELPVTTLATSCYSDMFSGCTSLTTAPELPATTLVYSCYWGMFCNCASLTTAPELPATTLAASCYRDMFYGCTSLTTPPELPATTLAQSCYSAMFRGCTSLTTPPELPATTLTTGCYSSMFYGCTGIKLSATKTSEYGIPYRVPISGNGVTASNALSYMFTSTGGTFRGTPIINTTYYLWGRDPADTAIKFSSDDAFTLATANGAKNWNGSLEYSTDLKNWTTWDGTTTLNSSDGTEHVLYVRGTGNSVISGGSGKRWTLAGTNISCTGNIENLLNHETVTAGGHPSMVMDCYSYLFYNCTSLTTAPELPATTLAPDCYTSMFFNCTSLTAAPELPATTLEDWCYASMFNGCTSLTAAPELPATTLAEDCYSHMFDGCTSLTIAPDLPATALTSECYSEMFYDCTSLTTAPELPATVLEDMCYYGMFKSCTSLTTAPELPATTLAWGCYYEMFYDCDSLAKLPELPATTLAEECYNGMFAYCTGIKLSATKTNEYGIPYRVPISGDGVTASNALAGMFNNTGGTFRGTPEINRTYHLWGRDPADTAIKFSSEDAFTLATANGAQNWDGTLEYSTDLKNWTTWDGTTTLNSSDGIAHVLYVRGTGNSVISGGSGKGWTLTGSNISCSGNIENLLNHETVTAGGHPSMGANCYSYMFNGCTSLTTAPELPATTLANACYRSMFNGCTSLTTAPELPATTLANDCYSYMFQDCTGLTTAPELPATTLASYCYYYMFKDCTGLTTAPELPATTLASYCYSYMFQGCTGLTAAPELPATTPASYCYDSMFRGCTGLTTAPELPATTLASYCYNSMFYGCTGIKLSATKTSEYGIPYRVPTSGDGVTASNALSSMFSSTGGTFRGTPSINTTYYLWGTDPADTAIKFSSDDAFTLATANGAKNWNGSLEYSTDLNNWTTWDGTTTINSSDGAEHVLYVRGTGNTVISGVYSNSGWTLTGANISCSGNIENLLNHETVTAGEHPSMGAGCYHYMFKGCTSLTTAPELPATTLDSFCYFDMFNGCTSLTTAPELPATTLSRYCYNSMFQGCTSLTSAPDELPATVLANFCYANMFNGCTSLTTAPELPATTLAPNCYLSMFQGCTSLTSAPDELPATTLANYCYANMFNGCTSLTAAPELPATTLAQYCYFKMFDGCTSLTTPPELPAATLAESCYSNMFDGCTSLTMPPELPATTLAQYCYYYMFYGCTSLTTPPALPATTLAENCYQGMFCGCTGIKLSTTKTGAYTIPYRVPSVGDGTTANYALLDMFTGTGGTFGTYLAGTPSINTTYYLYDPEYIAALKFSSPNEFTLATKNNTKKWNGTLEYSTDLNTWNTWDGTTTLNSSADAEHVLYVRGTGNTVISGGCWDLDNDHGQLCGWTFTGTDISCSGSIENLLDYATVIAGGHPSMGDYCFDALFAFCDNLVTAPELPATALTKHCYHDMFNQCTGLTTVPELPATTLAPSCCQSMFAHCTSLLTTPPEFPATTLAELCYYDMFNGCTSLTTVPELPATTLATRCYMNMFAGCTSLKLSTTKTGAYTIPYRVPTSGNGVTASKALTNMFANTGGTFGTINLANPADVYASWSGGSDLPGTPSINTTYYLWNYELEAATLKFSSPSSFSLTTANGAQNWDGTLQYSTDLTSWSTWSGTTTLNAVKNGSEYLLYLRGTDNSVISGGDGKGWTLTGSNISCSGNIENLLNYEAVTAGEHPNMGEYCYSYLFSNCANLTTAPELPATTLADWCYWNMFYGCTSLTTAPELPATTLAAGCYKGMFYGCTSLTATPELPATTLAGNCYYSMFCGCTNLTTAPELPATTLAEYCYYCMFSDCTSLTSAPDELPATTLANSCYRGMFQNCTSLTSAPELPATTLSEYCYRAMFYNCTSLTTAPELPATTLSSGCYTWMFENCTSLTTAPELPATTLAQECYRSMFHGCTSLTTAPELPATTMAEDCYAWMFEDCTSLTTAPELPATTLAQECYRGMFMGCTSLTTAPELPTTTLASYCYSGMFQGCTSLTSAPDELPATTLAENCYYSMFYNCTSLTTAPELPATTLAPNCYSSMFDLCTSLTTAPELPATTLAEGCYDHMFWGCTSLTTAPDELPATTLAENCYYSMFYNCTSLTTAPELPATTLAENCCYCMFWGCTSLSMAPELPATTLAENCYYGMFWGCTSLSMAPELPATTLAQECYRGMFEGCTSLTSAPELPATTLAQECYRNMFYNCTSLTTAPELPATTLAENCYYYMFYGCTSLKLSATKSGAYTIPYRVPSVGGGTTATNALTSMFTGTGGTFAGTPSINTTYYLYDPEYIAALKFSSPNEFTLATTNSKKNWDGTLEYSTDLDTWNTWDGATTLNSSDDAEHVLYVRGTGNSVISGDGKGWTLTGTNISASGNIESLLDYATIASGNHPSMATWCYGWLFDGCAGLTNAVDLELPATTLASYCYSDLFQNCANLATAPRLLPATTLAQNCYAGMFQGCASLATPPELSAISLAQDSCYEMFRDCVSLTEAPALNATTLAHGCYISMFQGCTSLTTAPELPATTLAQYCYQRMFQGCTGLTTPPELPATTLAQYCYYQMFYGCSNIKLSTTKTGAYTIPYRVPKTGSGTTASNALSQMFSGTGGTFAGTPSINTTYYLWDHELEAATLKFSSPSSFSLKTANSAKNWDGTLQYSTNLTSWTTWSGTTTLNAVKNGSEYLLYLRGTGNSVITGGYGKGWTLTGSNISCTGNIENLLNHETVTAGGHPSMGAGCYQSMFADCTSLTTAPELPATTLAERCYLGMFYGCSNMVDATELPATTLAVSCYSQMFSGCTSLATAPELPATTLAERCYWYMFDDCTSLTTAPELPATTLASYCYQYMFRGCTCLTTAPELPATTLADQCYSQMFSGCTSLAAAPELPATTLALYCYQSMFVDCTSLTTPPELPATTLKAYCYSNMFSGCTSLKLSTTKTGAYTIPYRVPSVGDGSTTGANALTNMFTGTGGTFTGTPSINTTYYLAG